MQHGVVSSSKKEAYQRNTLTSDSKIQGESGQGTSVTMQV
jgi:hypothetical protein